ncbi:ribosomal RNA small subunit methyltransferase E [Edaphobacter acidisoli]|uniref:Ribosomal RNA small subunit methyltransferase E n=1 Tax=Edaphobacter acidisoli TaxID=2040573 RepID=A0A916RYP3_9BACT|nr:16S rRNA (uracil(1498)-N(3))-methyltransferase [Edaphobacter acidisoli]GGA76867.1 ribosomal RNA small subunit methyltransferase E [Edaphobacter acidisoli]
MTRRRFIADTWSPTTATLTGDQAIHLARVLRAEPGQIYDVVAGGFLHRAEITTVSPTEVHFTLHEELESDSALPLHLLLAVFKFDHMEWAIEKATELGVERITPILARRTEKHLAQASAKRAERWRRIALEASKQSRRTTIPEIADPIALKPALEQEQSPIRILLSETEQATPLAEALRQDQPTTSNHQPTTALAIGPEGGWTQDEMALFTQHQWQPVTLGPRILRAETAAIAAIAIAASILQPN